ncbi:acetyl-CoA synthetase-like protein [Gautieria morchelliformis]|nr:acetyl-CoA synthetase-like protein [Gautieria morchelliformis]
MTTHKVKETAYTLIFLIFQRLSGLSYSDVVQIYGVSKAGYVPQLFSIKLPNPTVVFELLTKANATALIYDPSFEANLDNSPVPVYEPADVNHVSEISHKPLLPPQVMISDDEPVFVFHTSGSTSGSPKLVRCSRRWLDNFVHKADQVCKPRDSKKQDVTTWLGSICHVGQSFMLIGFLHHGACTIQPTQIAFSSEELSDMVDRCGLNRLNQFAPFLEKHLRNSHSNPKLLNLLQSLDEVIYSGACLGPEEENWASNSGILMRYRMWCTMWSVGGRGRDARYLRPLQDASCAFLPIHKGDPGHTNAMLELVILSNSGDCPDSSFRSATDGHFHTGDLFEEVSPGCFVYKGRDDDWIKCADSLRCDTKSIEDHVRTTCSELIGDCVVVGSGRPSPALFVEPAKDDMDHAKIRADILQRTQDFHARRYLHERITDINLIIVVNRGTLPRQMYTKGNIRRKAVEEMFKEKLDQIYIAA